MALGIDCTLYRNTGTWGSPTWNEVPIISDFTVDPQWDRAEAMTRETRIKRGVSTLLSLPFTGKILVKEDDADYLAFLTAFNAQSSLDLLILSNTNVTDGAEGYRLEVNVVKFTDDQGVGVLRYRDFTLEPALTANLPQKASVSGGSLSLTDF